MNTKNLPVEFSISLSKSGKPTFTEYGGSATNTGNAMGISNPDGTKKYAIFVPKKYYANGEHDIFIVNIGDLICSAKHSRNGESFIIYKVTEIKTETSKIVCEYVGEYENNDATPLTEQQMIFGKAILQKSFCYHCRCPHYSNGTYPKTN